MTRRALGLRAFAVGALLLASACQGAAGDGDAVPRAAALPTIDGLPTDAVWAQAEWRALDQWLLGAAADPADISGRYKLLWHEAGLVLLAEVRDDVLIDARPDPVHAYWDDDALELFVDADASGGLHRDDYNAFAYHIALDGQAIDIAPTADGGAAPRAFPDHVEARWQRDPDDPALIYWEVLLRIFDAPTPTRLAAQPRRLTAGERLGFMVAYCDADDAGGRQHFLGDVDIEPVDGDRNRGYIDADVFRTIVLAGPKAITSAAHHANRETP